MSELSGIPMNYEEKYPTLNSMCHSKKQTEICVDIVEYYSENSRFDQKGIVAKSS
jgi:hypothetical protein